MCTVSMVMDTGRDWFDPFWKGGSINVPRDRTDEVLRAVESLRELVAAAEKFDAETGQPDCVDPEKAALMKRVDELEARLRAVEAR